MLQCHNLRVDRGYYTGDIAQAVVSISQQSRDCWCLRLIGALTTRSGNRRVLRLGRLKLHGQNAPKTASPLHCERIVLSGGT